MRKIQTDLKRKTILFKMGRVALSKNFPCPPLPISHDSYLRLLQSACVSVHLNIRLTFLVCQDALEGECRILSDRCGEYYVEKYCTQSCNRKY